MKLKEFRVPTPLDSTRLQGTRVFMVGKSACGYQVDSIEAEFGQVTITLLAGSRRFHAVFAAGGFGLSEDEDMAQATKSGGKK